MLNTRYFSYSAFWSTGQWVRGGQKPPPIPWLRYSHRMSKNYLHRTLIFLLSKVYFVQVFIQHTVKSNVITTFQKTFYLMFYQIDTLFVRNRTTVLRRRVARISQLGGCVGGWWSIQPPEANGGLGAEPPALENLAFFCKNNFILGLF